MRKCASLLQSGLISVGALFTLALVLAGPAAANGDPASDLLITNDAYTPFQSGVSKRSIAKLNANIAAVYASRYRIKVAVIGTRIDLGDVPSLFNKPQLYARFLGQELSTAFVGPLLIVMPAGFGILRRRKVDGGGKARPEEAPRRKSLAGRADTARGYGCTAAPHGESAALRGHPGTERLSGYGVRARRTVGEA